MVECPAGSYCPPGTSFATEFVCPNGTYSNRSNLVSDDQCFPCPPGLYCFGVALTEPTVLLCSAGYYCVGGVPRFSSLPCHLCDFWHLLPVQALTHLLLLMASLVTFARRDTIAAKASYIL